MTRIRPITIDDLDHMMTWVNDPEVVGCYAYFTKPITREEEAVWLSQKIVSSTDFVYAIEDDDETYLGNVGLEAVHWPARNGRLSITIARKSLRGKGHGTRAIELALEQAFGEHGLHKVYLVVADDNEPNRRLYEKLGFQEEGHLVDHYIIDGEFVDMIQMYLLEPSARS